jgi:hypothetical protein
MTLSAETKNLEPITSDTRLRFRDVFNEKTREAFYIVAMDHQWNWVSSSGRRFTKEEIQRDFKVYPEPDRMTNSLFCCLCFASEDGGSWGEGLIEGHCFNCGAGGSTFSLPRYAIQSIREQASWVGKRYYPSLEDLEASEERKRLLACVDTFHGRTVEPAETLNEKREWVPDPGRWTVKQKTPSGGGAQTTVQAETEEEAWEKARYLSLRYYTEADLP